MEERRKVYVLEAWKLVELAARRDVGKQWHVIACNFHHVPLGFGEKKTLCHVHLQELRCLQNSNTRDGKKPNPTEHCPFTSRRY